SSARRLRAAARSSSPTTCRGPPTWPTESWSYRCGRPCVRSLLLVAVGLIAASLLVHDGALATLLGAAGLVAAGVAWFESGADSTRELAVVATLGAAAAAGRVLFAAIPGVQPVTVIAV